MGIRGHDHSGLFRHAVPGGERLVLMGLLLLSVILWGCTDEHAARQAPILVKVGERTLTVSQFNQVLELSKAAYAHNDLRNPEVLQDLKLRVINQLIEEMILLEKADRLNITVSDAQLTEAIERIKSDYPEGVFEQMLIESAVSYETWKDRMKVRLLAQRVIDSELKDKVRVTAEEIADYYKRHYTAKEPLEEDAEAMDGTLDERVVRQLKEAKIQAAYAEWIERSRRDFPIEINTRQWDRLIVVRGSSPRSDVTADGRVHKGDYE